MTDSAIVKVSADLLASARESLGSADIDPADSHLRKFANFSAPPPAKFSGLTASAGEVAAVLGLKETSFRRKARAMHRDLGFPMPLAGGSWTWSTRAVAIWIEAQSGIHAEPASHGVADALDEARHEDEDGAITAPIILAQRRDLRRRYGGRA